MIDYLEKDGRIFSPDSTSSLQILRYMASSLSSNSALLLISKQLEGNLKVNYSDHSYNI